MKLLAFKSYDGDYNIYINPDKVCTLVPDRGGPPSAPFDITHIYFDSSEDSNTTISENIETVRRALEACD